MLERKTIIDQIEIQRDGTVQVRMKKCIVDSDDPENPISAEYHRTVFPPGVDVEAQMQMVNAHLVQMKAGACTNEELDRVRRVVAVEHTPEAVQRNRARAVAEEKKLAARG